VHGRRQAFLTTDIQALVLGIGKECSCRKMAAGSWVYPVFGIDPFSESTTFRRNYCKTRGFKPLRFCRLTTPGRPIDPLIRGFGCFVLMQLSSNHLV
jgi:hypothetical protein